MKLESLKSSKFEAFKSNELQNAMQFLGCALTGEGTINTEKGCNDYMDDKSDDTPKGDVCYSVLAGSTQQVQAWVQNGDITFTQTVNWELLPPC